MIVNRAALQGIFVGFQTIFNKAFSETTSDWEKIATKVPSTTSEESYKWLGSIPKMREWIGSKQIQNLSAHDYTIKNKDFESTISVSRNDIEDDKIGIYAPMAQSVAQSAAVYPNELVFKLLKEGFKNKCYDGSSFFATDHKVGKKAISNKGTAKLTVASYAKARAEIMSFKDENGNSLGVIPNLLVVPPSLEGEARKILMADQIDGSSNVYKGTAEVLVSTELSGADTTWYLLCNTKPIKPLLFQERKPAKLVSLNNDTDENVFFNKEYLFSAEARGNAGYGLWQMAYGSDGSTN